MVNTKDLSGIRISMQYFAGKDDDKKPDEEKPKDEQNAPETEKKDEPKADEPKDDKSENAKPDEKQEEPEPKSEEEGKGDKPADKSDEKAEEPPKDEPKEEAPAAPDEKDEEILRLKTQIAAMQLGISGDCMEDAVAIAESRVKSGKADDINKALEDVVKAYPAMKADGGKGDKSKSDKGFKVGAGDPASKSSDDDRLNEAFGLNKKK